MIILIGVMAMSSIAQVTDKDGNTYKTVKIGTQTWTAENLKTKHYNNGDAIPDGKKAGDIRRQNKPEYWFVYGNKSANEATYGLLYTWYAATDSRNICPGGFHVPTHAEWTTLTDSLGNDAGGKMKETGTAHWINPNTGATNSSGFSALPGSFRFPYGTFFSAGSVGEWWSASETDTWTAWRLLLNNDVSQVSHHDFEKEYGFSVRCLKD